MKILITCGATREHIDDVRYITNQSSGIMGLRLAEEAASRGFDVTLIHGPMNFGLPSLVECIPVISSQEMVEAALKKLSQEKYDLVISAAALADYTPDKKVDGKIRSGSEVTVKLKSTKKLLGEIRSKHPDLKLAGFKAEYHVSPEELEARARELLDKYSLSLVAANDVSQDIFGSSDTRLLLVTSDKTVDTGRVGKQEAASLILDLLQ
jgi:phosphopantothenoylcysteine decarboxylase/phosphopantothenate--cysteine ligase